MFDLFYQCWINELPRFHTIKVVSFSACVYLASGSKNVDQDPDLKVKNAAFLHKIINSHPQQLLNW